MLPVVWKTTLMLAILISTLSSTQGSLYNVALHQYGSICDTYRTDFYGYPQHCENAFDGKRSSSWNGVFLNIPTPWIVVYFPRPYTLVQGKILHGDIGYRNAENITISFSDNTVLHYTLENTYEWQDLTLPSPLVDILWANLTVLSRYSPPAVAFIAEIVFLSESLPPVYNAALSYLGSNCSASSPGCDSAIMGHYNPTWYAQQDTPGAWIQINFPQQLNLLGTQFLELSTSSLNIDLMKMQFSDGSVIQTRVQYKNPNVMMMCIRFTEPVYNVSWVRTEILSLHKNADYGFRELIFLTKLKTDPCADTICLNGGTCVQMDLILTYCNCPEGLSGLHCEEENGAASRLMPATELKATNSRSNKIEHGITTDLCQNVEKSMMQPEIRVHSSATSNILPSCICLFMILTLIMIITRNDP
eukprot:GHVT01098978.1.p1 GENE.GHVT01098978.1~~GHVT01098978.1.p1  ORF type:complete len:417 (-),score=-18.85 GHVT01098978.1:188-1438(-)